MIKPACHCGAVRFEIAEPPEWVLDCNCTLCRRYGAMWSYYHGADQAKLVSASPGTVAVVLQPPASSAGSASPIPSPTPGG